jgi:succinylglutamate desuccinylase
MKIKRVAIVGGTHGNELTGVMLVKKFLRYAQMVQRQSFETVCLLANPLAIKHTRSYIDRDLNRCFDRHDLANPALAGYENILAKQLFARYGSNGSEPVDVILDLHSTTANMGTTIIPISNSPANLQLAAYLKSLDPTIHIYLGLHSNQNSPMLRSMATVGCTIEMGAISPGVVDANILQKAEWLVLAALNYMDNLNRGVPMTMPITVNIYQAIEAIDYPRNGQNELTAMIHPDRQGQDYQPLSLKDPLFIDLQGKTIFHEDEQTVFPVFINEAAYYEKGIAMVLTKQQTVATDYFQLEDFEGSNCSVARVF